MATPDDAAEAIDRPLASAPADTGDAIKEAMRPDHDRFESALAAATADD